MDERTEKKLLRKQFSSLGWALLIYALIMSICVSLFMVVDIVVMYLRTLSGEVFSEDQFNSQLAANGWGYLLAIAIGFVILLAWKGKDFCFRTVWTPGKPMRFLDFVCLLCLFISGQMAFQLTASVQEFFFNLFGLTALPSTDAATMTADTFSFFLYAGIGAPIAEEILFRGLILRQLEPQGKGFAIVVSAFLFGIFHANVVQTPYAFLIGLVLGYVAVEHNILWAMVLHMINNLLLADFTSRLSGWITDSGVMILQSVIILLCTVGAVVVVIDKREEIAAYCRCIRIRDRDVECFATSSGIIALMVYVLLNMAMLLFL